MRGATEISAELDDLTRDFRGPYIVPSVQTEVGELEVPSPSVIHLSTRDGQAWANFATIAEIEAPP